MGKYGDIVINLLDDVPPFKATILLANLSLRQLSKKNNVWRSEIYTANGFYGQGAMTTVKLSSLSYGMMNIIGFIRHRIPDEPKKKIIVKQKAGINNNWIFSLIVYKFQFTNSFFH